MDCERCVESLDAFVDGELLPDEAEAVRRHLESCADCARVEASRRETSRRLRATLTRHPAPDVLKARIRASLVAEGARATPRPRRRWLPAPAARWRVAASLLAAAALGSLATAAVMRRGGDATPPMADAVLASHIRSLMPGHLTDVASTDQHNVKPWFNGRATLSPPVPRLDSAGFPLVGGRLDYVGEHVVPVVIYLRRQHVINVFWWPPQVRQPASPASGDNGYHLVAGRRDGLEFWAVSDLNDAELREFARRLERE